MSSHHAIIYGLVYKKEYYIEEGYITNSVNVYTSRPRKPEDNYKVKVAPKVKHRLIEMDKERIYEGSIGDPYLEIGEKLYVPEIDKTIEITDRVRILGGGYCYYTNHVLQTIEDEKQKEEVYSAFYGGNSTK